MVLHTHTHTHRERERERERCDHMGFDMHTPSDESEADDEEPHLPLSRRRRVAGEYPGDDIPQEVSIQRHVHDIHVHSHLYDT